MRADKIKWCHGGFAMRRLLPLTVAMLTGLVSFGFAADPKKSSDVVKITTKAEKPDAEGKQLVTVTLNIESPWHLYANPVGNDDLKSVQTTVNVTGTGKPEIASVEFPAGKKISDKEFGEYSVYEKSIAIKVTIKRPAGTKDEVELAVKIQACNDKTCLPPATLKTKVEAK
jgi:uncharacterized protein